MRDDEVRRALREMNPWWLAADTGDRLGWAEVDITLRRAGELGLDYRPPILADVVDGGRAGESARIRR